jgi:hypothetical protein
MIFLTRNWKISEVNASVREASWTRNYEVNYREVVRMSQIFRSLKSPVTMAVRFPGDGFWKRDKKIQFPGGIESLINVNKRGPIFKEKQPLYRKCCLLGQEQPRKKKQMHIWKVCRFLTNKVCRICFDCHLPSRWFLAWLLHQPWRWK